MAIMAPVDRVDRFPGVAIVHVGFSASCDRYDLCFVQTNDSGGDGVQHRTVKTRR